MTDNEKQPETKSSTSSSIGYYLLVIGIVGLRYPFGGYLAITGPTLLHLSRNVGASFETVAWVFTVYSISYIIAAIFTGFGFSKVKSMQQKVVIIATSLVLCGAVFFFVPLSDMFVYLIGIYMTSGLVWGFLNVASMQMILTIWDSAKSRPIVQISLMMFSLGALTTSTSCRYFLSQSPTEIKCGNVDESIELDSLDLQPNVSEVVETNLTDLPFHQHAEFWPYTINALMHVVFGVILLASTAFNKSEQQSSIIAQKRPEKSISEIWVYGLFYTMFHIGTALDLVYHSMISTYSYCGPMQMTTSAALGTNFNFWIANFLGRIFMIPISARFRPKYLIMFFGSLGASALIFQTVFSGNPAYAWTVQVSALIIGSSFSGMMGLGISYGNEFTNMGGRYAMLTFIGMQFTGAVIVKLTGFLMKTYSYECLMYVTLTLAAIQALGFFGVTKIGQTFVENDITEFSDEKEKDEKEPLKV